MWIVLPKGLILLLDFLAWFFFHMTISIFILKVPDRYYQYIGNCFKSFKWEENGQFWNHHFHVRKWKDSLPDSSSIFKTAYNKKEMKRTNLESLEKFIIETQRAELAHWLSMLPAPLFFIWNPAWAGWIMVIYAFLANFPFIIIQRYNRPRLLNLLQTKRQRSKI